MSWGSIDPTSRFVLARGVGDGTFELPVTIETVRPEDSFKMLRGLELGDLDGDGHLDVFTSDGDLFIGNGLGQLQDGRRFGVRASRVATRRHHR